jgi:hypothetical protein|nr:MAG TPA_asm: hypothetical protein [Bacteriophage sp.]
MNKEEKIALIRDNVERMIKLVEDDKNIEVRIEPIVEVNRDITKTYVTNKKVGEVFSIIYKK